MAATVVRSTRPATVGELQRLRGRANPASSLAYIAAAATLPGIGAFFLGRSIAGAAGGVVGTAIVAAGAAVAAGSFLRFHSQFSRRAGADLRARTIEILLVDDAQPLAIPVDHSSVDPAFAFELAGGRTLILAGQWLTLPQTFGADGGSGRGDADEGDAYANGLPPPYAFPVSAFTVHRFPASGVVMRIEVRGGYLAPATLVPPVDLRRGADADSYVIECAPPDLPAHIDATRTG